MINFKSVRFRLTLWYSTSFFIAMAVIFSFFYIFTEKTLFSHVDSIITSHSQVISQLISGQSMTTELASFENPVLSRQFGEMPGMILFIGDPYGKISSKSQNLGENEKILADLLEKSANIISPVFANRNLSSTPIRMGIFPVRRNDQTIALILMGQPIDVIQNSLNTLKLTLVLVSVVLSIPTIAGGFLLAQGAMLPISRFSNTIKNINEKNLNERVENPQTNDEIEKLAETFNNLLDRLHQAFNRERQFIGDVAHELKTPLATMRTGVEVALSKERTKTEYQKILSDTLIDMDQLSGTITNILDLAWSQTTNTSDETFNLSDLISDLKDLTVKMGWYKKVKVLGSIQKNVYISGQKDKIFRAILNILDNAVKYNKRGGKIYIALKSGEIKISDTGQGIPSSDLPYVFDRFYRGSKTTQVLGSGLGLAIANSIIEAQRGTMNIESTLGKGTTVTIKFPIKI